MPHTVTCHTPGCGNENLPVLLDLDYQDEDGNWIEITNVVCGPCGQPIASVERVPA